MKKEDAIKYLQQLYPNGGHCWLDEQRIEAIGMAIKALQEESAPKIFEDMLNAKTAAESLGISPEEHDKIVDECLYGKEPELVDEDDLPKEEPVSEGLEEVSKNYALNNTPWDDCKDEIQEAFKAGAQWQKTKDESTTEDLGEYINELSKQFPEVSFAKLSRIAVRVSRWQKTQDTKNKLPKVTDRTELDEYAYQCAYDMSNDWAIENPTWHDVEDACKLGANWQKEQFEKNRLAAFDRQTEEEAEIEQSFLMGIIECEHRQPTFDDAIKYGMRLQKVKIMKDAFESRIKEYSNGSTLLLDDYNLYQRYMNEHFKAGDKVRLIIIKEN